MLNDPRSHGLWETTAPSSPATESLSDEVDADVVIVGGGYTGLSSALHLAEGGATVVLLEAVDVGFGGAGRNVGLVNAGMWVMPNRVVAALGTTYGERLLKILGDAPQLVFDLIDRHRIDCEAVRAGTLHCAVGSRGFAELQQRTAQWLERGAPVSLLDAAATAVKVGTAAYAGSLLDMRAGTVQPLAYARGLAGAAMAAGARIFVASPVTAAERTSGKWRLRTPRGAVLADWIIVASDAYSTGPWSALREEQVRLPYFNFATEPLAQDLRMSILPERQGVWDTRNVLSSFRFDRAGRLVFGSVGALRGTGTTVHRAWARRALRALFPRIGAVNFDAEWYGEIGMTRNNLPRFHVLAPNLISFCGYNGRGIAPGTVFGRILSDYILGRIADADLPLPVTTPAGARLRTMREGMYEVGAQLVHLVQARF
ncbi:MAG: FAD-binding oxidoreductase [Steroidobacteraceae bacterium]